MNGAGARRQKALVPLIEAGHESSHRQRDSSPYEGPARIVLHRNGSPPGTKKQDAQDGITNNVACFSDQEMPSQESDRVQTEKEVENRIQDPAGVLRGKRSGGFNRDYSQPDDGWYPSFPNTGTMMDGALQKD